MSDAGTSRGASFCGAVEVDVKGAPDGMSHCHCNSCRSGSASPINAFALREPSSVMVTRGADRIAGYHETEQSHRKRCRTCGGHVFTDHRGFGLVDDHAATIPRFPSHRLLHVYYAEAVLKVRDGTPRFGDFPAQFGGAGRTRAE